MKFELTELKRLFKDGTLKDHLDAKNYILKFFYPTDSGMIVFKNDDDVTMMTMETFRATYLMRFPKDLKNWFLTETELYKIGCDTKTPFLDGTNLNLFRGFKHEKQPYKKFKKTIKENVQFMLDFVKKIWCSDNDVSFKYIVNWFANLVQGNKNETILYLKSFTEGIGKSTFTTFMMRHVIGTKISIESSSEPLKTSFNESLAGKVMVVFEELESSSTTEWSNISSRLKKWTTSRYIEYANKYIKSYTAENINNYIICSNEEAVKNSEGRRYYILDLNTCLKGKYDYWEELHERCFNDEVGQAFFNYLLEIDISGFRSNVFVDTISKKESYVDRLHPLFKFIKFNYIYQNQGLKITTKELYDNFLAYLDKIECAKKITKSKMISLLRECGIEYKSSNSKMIYNINHDDLKKVGDKFKWYHDDDLEELDNNNIFKEATTTAVDYIGVARSEYKKVCEERDQALIRIKELELMIQTSETPKAVTKTAKKVVKKQKSTIDDFINL